MAEMLSWHVVGQKVQLRKGFVPTFHELLQALRYALDLPQPNTVYTIRRVGVPCEPCGVVCFHLNEVRNRMMLTPSCVGDRVDELWFCADAFEPVQTRETSIECFETILREAKVDAPVPEPVE